MTTPLSLPHKRDKLFNKGEGQRLALENFSTNVCPAHSVTGLFAKGIQKYYIEHGLIF
jgi:hypothetical protein